MTKWEYDSIVVHGKQEDWNRLERMGTEGWEAFAVMPETDTSLPTILLKRPIEKLLRIGPTGEVEEVGPQNERADAGAVQRG